MEGDSGEFSYKIMSLGRYTCLKNRMKYNGLLAIDVDHSKQLNLMSSLAKSCKQTTAEEIPKDEESISVLANANKFTCHWYLGTETVRVRGNLLNLWDATIAETLSPPREDQLKLCFLGYK